MAQCQGLRAQRFFFFGIHLFNIWQEDIAKIPKVPGAPRNVNPARAITLGQSWAFKKHTVKRKRKFRNQNFSSVKRKRKFRNQNFLSSKRKRKFRN